MEVIDFVIREFGDRIEHADELLPSGFCLFHDPNAWKDRPEKVRKKFLKWLREKEEDPSINEILAIGFRLPDIDLSKHQFQKNAIFPLTRFSKASLWGASFEKADFRGARFGEVHFEGTRFKEAHFEGAQFGRAYFEEARFEEAHFEDARFEEAHFEGTRFKEAHFEGARFERSYFEDARFGRVNFGGAHFKEWAHFRGAHFRRAYFLGTRFEEWVKFRKSRFEEANFGEARFGRAYFEEARFREANFEGARFGRAYFRGAHFKKTSFRKARFGEVNFGEARFGRAYFEEAYFKKAYFVRTQFEKEVSFRRATVKEALVFSDLRMHLMFNKFRRDSYISLRNLNFDGRSTLGGGQVRRELDATAKGGHIVIDNCFVDRFSFINTELSPERLVIRNPKYSFGGREILLVDKLLFLAKTKYQKHGSILKKYLDFVMALEQEGTSNHLKIRGKLSIWFRMAYFKALMTLMRLDKLLLNELTYTNKLTEECRRLKEEKIGEPTPPELNAELVKEAIEDLETISKDEELTLDNVLSVYRGLREHYDYGLRYEDSGRLFVGEMRLREKMSSWLGDRIFFWLYDRLAVYGESIWRPVVASALVILLFSILLNWDRMYLPSSFLDFLSGLLSPEWNFTVKDISDSVSYWLTHLKLRESLMTFFQLRKMENCGWFSLLERLVAIPVLGSFIVSLRRKLERRIRH